MEKEDCDHCKGTGRCSCDECKEKNGAMPEGQTLADCSYCGGSGKIKKNAA